MQDREKAGIIITAVAEAMGSVANLAKAIDCTPVAIYSWIRGTSYPNEEMRGRIAKVFHFDVSDFTNDNVQYDIIDLEEGVGISDIEIPPEYKELNNYNKRKVLYYILGLHSQQKH